MCVSFVFTAIIIYISILYVSICLHKQSLIIGRGKLDLEIGVIVNKLNLTIYIYISFLKILSVSSRRNYFPEQITLFTF